MYKMKLLVATKYVHNGNGIKTAFDGTNETVEQLAGDGSYKSKECEDILNASDVVITNPPFSKLSDYIPFVIDHNVDVVLIVNMMMLATKRVEPYILSKRFNDITSHGACHSFTRPDGTIAHNIVAMITTF